MSSDGALRLLLVTDAIGGVWTYSVDLARTLASAGVEVMLAVIGPAPEGEQRSDARALAGVTLIETGLPLDWLSDGPAPVLQTGATLAGIARERRVDVVHLNMPALAAAGSMPVPCVVVAHGCISTWWQAAHPGLPLDPAMTWHQALAAAGLRAADRVVAPTASFARRVAELYGLPQVPETVHNGCRPPAGGVPTVGAGHVLTAGRLWDRVKRTSLLDAVAGLLPMPFLAAGPVESPHGERVETRHLRLLGQLDSEALDREMAAAPLFVSAANFEPFGLAVLEAANAGCPLVLSDIDSFRELWEGAATFVTGDDPGSWAAVIGAIMGDPERRARLGAEAGRRARRYTAGKTGAAMLRIYRELGSPKAPEQRFAA